ncbi:MAG: response regulator [Verrucomicrobiota bacterium]
MHVLIADDHALFRKALTMLVGKIDDGATCEGVGSVEELKQVCVNRQFDVVLLDIGLPDFDWPEQIDESNRVLGHAASSSSQEVRMYPTCVPHYALAHQATCPRQNQKKSR